MSRAAIMAKVQTILQGLTARFNSTSDVTVGDWTVLDRGSPTGEYAVVWPGDWDMEDYDFGGEDAVKFTWGINVDLFERYLNEADTYASLDALNELVVAELNKYPTLAGLVQHFRARHGDEPSQVFDRDGGGPHFLMTTVRVQAEELSDITGGEYS